MKLSSILLKNLHVISFKDNSDDNTITIKFDFGVEKTYTFNKDTFDSLISNKERMKGFLSHTSKYEIENTLKHYIN
jgi:hypothetical protein